MIRCCTKISVMRHVTVNDLLHIQKRGNTFCVLVEVQKTAMMSKFLSSQPVFTMACYTGTIFNLQIVSLTQCISVKLGTFV